MDWGKNLTIGIPVRNEAGTLEEFFDSLKASVDFLPEDLMVETIICINGCTDDSEEISQQLVHRFKNSHLNLTVLHSQKGKMEAQRAILASRRFQGMVAFFDADIILDHRCLLNLWNTMQENPDLQLAYARVKALNHGYETIVEWMESVHYVFPHLLSPRRYFHGRGYLIRPTKLFFLEPQEEERVRNLAEKSSRFLWMQLKTGPLVDDIYLSRVLVHTYGFQCIREVQEAVVNFTAPRTLKDFYEGQRRLLTEIRRLDILFPEHVQLGKNFERKPDHTHIRKMEYNIRIHHLLYRSMEKCVRAWIRISILWSDCFRRNSSELWVSLESTKKFLGGKND
jgi:glycosyltransferase involved in cell wall biosynthesis